MEFVGDAILIANKDNEFIYHNLTFKSIFGYDHNKNQYDRARPFPYYSRMSKFFLNIVNVLKEKPSLVRKNFYEKHIRRALSGAVTFEIDN